MILDSRGKELGNSMASWGRPEAIPEAIREASIGPIRLTPTEVQHMRHKMSMSRVRHGSIALNITFNIKKLRLVQAKRPNKKVGVTLCNSKKSE